MPPRPGSAVGSGHDPKTPAPRRAPRPAQHALPRRRRARRRPQRPRRPRRPRPRPSSSPAVPPSKNLGRWDFARRCEARARVWCTRRAGGGAGERRSPPFCALGDREGFRVALVAPIGTRRRPVPVKHGWVRVRGVVESCLGHVAAAFRTCMAFAPVVPLWVGTTLPNLSWVHLLAPGLSDRRSTCGA